MLKKQKSIAFKTKVLYKVTVRGVYSCWIIIVLFSFEKQKFWPWIIETLELSGSLEEIFGILEGFEFSGWNQLNLDLKLLSSLPAVSSSTGSSTLLEYPLNFKFFVKILWWQGFERGDLNWNWCLKIMFNSPGLQVSKRLFTDFIVEKKCEKDITNGGKLSEKKQIWF